MNTTIATHSWPALALHLGRVPRTADYILSPPDRDQRPWSSTPARAQRAGSTARLSNGLLDLSLHLSGGKPVEAVLTNHLTKEKYSWQVSEFTLLLDGQTLKPESFSQIASKPRQSQQVASIEFTYRNDSVVVRVRYRLAKGQHYLRKHVEVEARQPLVVKDARLLDLRAKKPLELVLHDGGAYLPIVFARAPKGGIFACVEGSASAADIAGAAIILDQFPGQHLRPGESVSLGPAVIGVWLRSGRTYRNPYHPEGAELDRGERNWFIEYALDTSPSRAGGPILELSASGADDDQVIEKCEALGINHATGLSDASALAAARQKGIHTGAVIPPSHPLAHEWSLISGGAPAAHPCLASPYADWQIEQCERAATAQGHRDALLGDPGIAECESPSHSHLPGKYAPFQAFAAHARWMDSLSEHHQHTRGYGAHACYGLNLASRLDGVALLADSHPLGLPDVRLMRACADTNRLYLRRSLGFLLAAHRLRSPIGCPRTLQAETHFDRESWRYSILSALSAGMWFSFNYFPADLPDEEKEFARQWFAWAQQNAKYLLRADPLLNEPGLDGLDGTAHIWQDEGFVFLFNPTYDPQSASLVIELSEEHEYWIAEKYPGRAMMLPQQGQFFKRGETLQVQLPPKSVRILEIRKGKTGPVPLRIAGVEVDGIRRVGTDVLAQVRGMPGAKAVARLMERRRSHDFDILFPGDPVQRCVTEWRAACGALHAGLDAQWQSGEFPSWPLHRARGAFLQSLWLSGAFAVPAELRGAFALQPGEASPYWQWERRLIGVIRIEPPSEFDPIRTFGPLPGTTESLWGTGHKAGISYSSEHKGEIRVWLNGVSVPLHREDSLPVAFADLTDLISYGQPNTVVIYFGGLNTRHFKGLFLENFPEPQATTTLTLPMQQRGARRAAAPKKAAARTRPARKKAPPAKKKPAARPAPKPAKRPAKPAPRPVKRAPRPAPRKPTPARKTSARKPARHARRR